MHGFFFFLGKIITSNYLNKTIEIKKKTLCFLTCASFFKSFKITLFTCFILITGRQIFGSTQAVNLGYKASPLTAQAASLLRGGGFWVPEASNRIPRSAIDSNLSEAKFLRPSLLDTRPAYCLPAYGWVLLLGEKNRADRRRKEAELEGEREKESERGKPGVDR